MNELLDFLDDPACSLDGFSLNSLLMSNYNVLKQGAHEALVTISEDKQQLRFDGSKISLLCDDIVKLHFEIIQDFLALPAQYLFDVELDVVEAKKWLANDPKSPNFSGELSTETKEAQYGLLGMFKPKLEVYLGEEGNDLEKLSEQIMPLIAANEDAISMELVKPDYNAFLEISKKYISPRSELVFTLEVVDKEALA